jgi:hypothetical protein
MFRSITIRRAFAGKRSTVVPKRGSEARFQSTTRTKCGAQKNGRSHYVWAPVVTFYSSLVDTRDRCTPSFTSNFADDGSPTVFADFVQPRAPDLT